MALAKYIQNHPVSTISYKGYVKWQKSTAQTQLLEDIESNLHVSMGSMDFDQNTTKNSLFQFSGTRSSRNTDCKVLAYSQSEGKATQE
jgi:hypothetical protein